MKKLLYSLYAEYLKTTTVIESILSWALASARSFPLLMKYSINKQNNQTHYKVTNLLMSLKSDGVFKWDDFNLQLCHKSTEESQSHFEPGDCAKKPFPSVCMLCG